MCSVCSFGGRNLACEYCCSTFNSPFYLELEKGSTAAPLNGKAITWPSRLLSEKHMHRGSVSDSLIAATAHSGILPPDMKSEIRENGGRASDNSQAQAKSLLTEERGSRNSFKNIGEQSFHDKNSLDGSMKATLSEELCTSVPLQLHRQDDNTDDKLVVLNNTLEDVRSIIDEDESDGTEIPTRTSNASFLSTFETNPLVWMPPAPVDIEDDMDSVAYNDDDDEYSDGTKWGQPSNLSGYNTEHGNSFKEEREKAIMDAMNGQFKILVSRFLASEDFRAEENHGENWLDIVASLSWEAALFIKPEANEGRAMDPASYIKVKCVATGARTQSEVVKGLVFKKNTAHKHMPTKCKNPRLLLMQGVLGHREVRLSSFEAMEEENDYLKSINEMIETCHPNVVLVEKSVSRDMQEFLLAKGMTLVFDMKITRLNRISRCIGCPIISCSDIPTNPKVQQCDMFHVEKFVEEHNCNNEGGKRPCKTLMFLEGFPKPLGCTILLKGAPIDELKKVKRVVQYTVFAAYHLILETSFFADQRALSSGMNGEGSESLKDKYVPSNCCGDTTDLNNSFFQSSTNGITVADMSDIPSSNGSVENSAHEAMLSGSNYKINGSSQSPRFNPNGDYNENNHADVYDKSSSNLLMLPDASVVHDLPWQLMSSFSSSLKKFLSDSFAPINPESFSSYFAYGEELDNQSVGDMPVADEHMREENGGFVDEKVHDEIPNMEKSDPLSISLNDSVEHNTADVTNKAETHKDNIENVLEPQSILILMSSQCIAKGLVCEQSHLSRIKYYGNFDVSLGRFLRDTLLNQKHICTTCSEPPDAHVYCYTHQNGNLTVLVRQLTPETSLSGEAEGKIWMWTRCLKCEHDEGGIPRANERVIMSQAACGLSFGKFLDLSFSRHSVASRLSSKCGHSLHRDCLRFFGLGSRVAMFRYSSVEIYAACKPPPVLDFHNPNGQDWIKREAKSVLQKGDLFFLEVANFLHKLKSGDSMPCPTQPKNFKGAVKDLSDVEEMLIQDKTDFEASLLKAINFSGKLGKAGNDILSLSWLSQELIFMLYIWDQRLHFLLQCIKDNTASRGEIQERCLQKNVERSTEDMDLESSIHDSRESKESSSSQSFHAQNCSSTEPELGMKSADISKNVSRVVDTSFDSDIARSHNITGGSLSVLVTECALSVHNEDPSGGQSDISCTFMTNDKPREVCGPSSVLVQFDPSSSVVAEQSGSTAEVAESVSGTDNTSNGVESSGDSVNSKLKDPNEWIWSPASDLRRTYRRDLHGGFLQKFGYINSYIPDHLSPVHLNPQERESLHFPVGRESNVISVCEDEISSIIACALAISEDKRNLVEITDEKEAMEGKGESDKAIDYLSSLSTDGSIASFWSSTGSSESEGMHTSRSISSLSSDDSSTSGSEASFFMDRSIAQENLHPEIPVGSGKATARGKYSVVLVHAKQFHALRRMCCPSEFAYISSLSRCKKWDAQGGKSKAFFAKTLDDRFIIKQVKKTEVDSFLTFASDYFRHISYSISSGSQTCLAKILGMYQVRQLRGGKEVKVDLMVMENLLFGRNFTRIYDLKGAVFSRYISDATGSEKVLLDQNFVEDMRIAPVYIAGKNKHLFQRAIWNDTSFLTSINVMDYSLLVGVDKQRRELVFGIIDYLRQYTWDKQLETWVKSSLVVPKNSLPTVISPKEYKKRFRKFMSKYFLTVPATWSSEQCTGPCKFCNGATSSSVESCHGSQVCAVSST